MQVCDFTKPPDMSFTEMNIKKNHNIDIGTISAITFSSREGYVVDPINIITFIGYGKKVANVKRTTNNTVIQAHANNTDCLQDFIGIHDRSFDQTEPIRGILHAWKTEYPTSRIIVPRGTLRKNDFIGDKITDNDWVWVNINEKKHSVCPKDILRKSHNGDILVVSNPLCIWGTNIPKKDLERIGMAVYTKGLFVLCDERMWRFSGRNAFVLPSVSSCCPERSVVVDEVYANGKRVCVASVGKHKSLSVVFRYLINTICGIPDTDTMHAATCMYSIEYARYKHKKLCAARKVIHVLKMFVCKYLGHKFTKIHTSGSGFCVLIPFPSSKIKKAKEKGVIVNSLEEYGMGGYIPLFLTDMNMSAAVDMMEMNSNNITIENVDNWVKNYAPNIYDGVKILDRVISADT